MGSQKQFNPDGGFSAYMYEEVGTITAGGISGKVVKSKGGGAQAGLPLYANKSRIYFKMGRDGKSIEQMRVYGPDRRAKLDFDYMHPHGSFRPPRLHVHDFGIRPDGNFGHLPARGITPKERALYEALLRKAMPDCDF